MRDAPDHPPELKAAARRVLFGETLRAWKPTPKVPPTPESDEAKRAAAVAFARKGVSDAGGK